MTVKPVTARLSQSSLVDASVLKSILKIGVLCFNKRFLYCVHNPENPYFYVVRLYSTQLWNRISLMCDSGSLQSGSSTKDFYG